MKGSSRGGGSSGGGSSGPTNQNVTTSNIAPWAQGGVSSLIQSAMQNVYPNQTTNPDGSINLGNQAGYTPFNYNTALNQPGSAQNQALSAAQSTTAGFSPLQQQAQQSAYNLQVPGQYSPASQMAGYGTANAFGMANSANPQDFQNQVGGYMNPYLQQALAPSLALQNQQFGQIAAQNAGQATQAGAFGGGRDAVVQGLNQQNQMLAQNQLVGNAYNNAFGQAQNQYNQSGGFALQANQAGVQNANTLAGIGGQQLAAQQGVIGTQAAQGATQQQQNQNILNQAMTNYNTSQTMPMTQLAQLESLYTGAPQNITTTGYTAAPSTVSQVAGLGTAAVGAAKLASMKAGGIVKMNKGGIIDLSIYKALGGKV